MRRSPPRRTIVTSQWIYIVIAFSHLLAAPRVYGAKLDYSPLSELAVEDKLASLVQYSFIRHSSSAPIPNDPNEFNSLLQLAVSEAETSLDKASSTSC